MFGRPTKRQRLEHPTCWLDCEALTSVPSLPRGRQQPQQQQQRQQQEAIVRNSLASKHIKGLFLDRFHNEIVRRFHFALSSHKMDDDDSYRHSDAAAETAATTTTTAIWRLQHLKERIRVGTNSCTRALEAALCSESAAPLLIVCAAENDTKPIVLPLIHIPAMAAQLDVPLLLLPGRASLELGKMLRAKKVSVMAFLPANLATASGADDAMKRDDTTNCEHDHHQELKASLDRDVNSFIDFVLSKAGLKK